MGANGFVEAFLQFLESAVHENNAAAQETGAMALFNIAVNNNRLVSTSCLCYHRKSLAMSLSGSF